MAQLIDSELYTKLTFPYILHNNGHFYSSDISSCTMNIRHRLKFLPSKIELLNLKRCLHRQKTFISRLITHRGLYAINDSPLECYRQGIRYNHALYIDRKTFELFGLSPMRNNPQVFIINRKLLNEILDNCDVHRDDMKTFLFNCNLNPNLCQRCFRPVTIRCRCKRTRQSTIETTEKSIQVSKSNIREQPISQKTKQPPPAAASRTNTLVSAIQRIIDQGPTELCTNATITKFGTTARLIAIGCAAVSANISSSYAGTREFTGFQSRRAWDDSPDDDDDDLTLSQSCKRKFKQSLFLERFRQRINSFQSRSIRTNRSLNNLTSSDLNKNPIV